MEPLKQTVDLPLEEPTQVAAARRAVRELGLQVGMAEEAIARAELVTVELAGNVLQHAGRGRLLVTVAPELTTPESGHACGLQVVGMDAGPGIASVADAMCDGFSTSTTPGYGLGAMERMAEGFDLYTAVGKGTVVSVTLGRATAPRSRRESATAGWPLGVLSTSFEGETVNGDSWGVYRAGGRTVYLMVDGLGHGLHASEAAGVAVRMAERAFAQNPEMPLSLLIQKMDEPMRATRGAAVLLASVADGVLTCCGAGNISGSVQSPDGSVKTLLSANGTVGHQLRGLREFTVPYRPGSLLILHTDGLSTRWRMNQYPGLEHHAAATIAGVLYRDAVRGRDDATVLVAHLDAHRDAMHAHGIGGARG